MNGFHFLQILCLQEVEEEHFISWFVPQLHHHGMLIFVHCIRKVHPLICVSVMSMLTSLGVAIAKISLPVLL